MRIRRLRRTCLTSTRRAALQTESSFLPKAVALPDFSHSVTARIPRKRGHLLRRLVALALAIGVPAFAAPSEWRAFPLTQAAAAEPVRPMGFETAGDSFPGSAFYYLADQPNTGQPSADLGGSSSFAAPSDVLGGPAA